MAQRNGGTRRNSAQRVFKGSGVKSKSLEIKALGLSKKRKDAKVLHLPKSIRTIVTRDRKEIITYVIDTCVIMHTYDAILNFKEHTVCIPGQVWKELDKHKQGHSDTSWNARKAIRLIDGLVAGKSTEELRSGIPIVSTKEFEVGPWCTGKIIFDFSIPQKPDIDVDLDINHPDDKIIMICIARKQRGERVVLVSNDGNCRVKARLCGIESEEYLSDAAITVRGEEDLRPGFHTMPEDFWEVQDSQVLPKRNKNMNEYSFTHSCLKEVYCNEFLVMEDGTLYRVIRKIKSKSVLAELVHPEKDVWGMQARNDEQIMALNLLMNPDIPAVLIAGRAGSGKTFLTLAAALEQTFGKKLYHRIIVTRALASAGDDIGFLPGTEEEKMDPWMGGIRDNLEVLAFPDDHADEKVSKKQGQSMTADYLFNKIQIKSINFMKGRSVQRTIVIVDESQDLTARQVKMLITRIGEGSKVVFLGNVAQIDNLYLTEHTCGLSVAIRAFADSDLVGHVTLQGGVRSPLAALAEERM